MLVLSRKLGERIIIPDSAIEITVVAIDGKNVRLGITAPRDVAVHREEIWQAVCAERRAREQRGY